jgi:hypothetical protein
MLAQDVQGGGDMGVAKKDVGERRIWMGSAGTPAGFRARPETGNAPILKGVVYGT